MLRRACASQGDGQLLGTLIELDHHAPGVDLRSQPPSPGSKWDLHLTRHCCCDEGLPALIKKVPAGTRIFRSASVLESRAWIDSMMCLWAPSMWGSIVISHPAESVRNAHASFERHSGWSAPDADTVGEWLSDGVCRCPDECLVSPAQCCDHGLASWWLILMALDHENRADPLSADQILPHPGRLNPGRPDYVTVVSTHHRALLAGEPGYIDPASGLYVLTARYLRDRGLCCDRGCRHCPFLS